MPPPDPAEPRGLFAQRWAKYAEMIPPDADETQVQETRRAFYAGGKTLLMLMLSVLSEDAEPTDEDLRIMDALNDEFDAFYRAIGEGRA